MANNNQKTTEEMLKEFLLHQKGIYELFVESIFSNDIEQSEKMLHHLQWEKSEKEKQLVGNKKQNAEIKKLISAEKHKIDVLNEKVIKLQGERLALNMALCRKQGEVQANVQLLNKETEAMHTPCEQIKTFVHEDEVNFAKEYFSTCGEDDMLLPEENQSEKRKIDDVHEDAEQSKKARVDVEQEGSQIMDRFFPSSNDTSHVTSASVPPSVPTSVPASVPTSSLTPEGPLLTSTPSKVDSSHIPISYQLEIDVSSSQPEQKKFNFTHPLPITSPISPASDTTWECDPIIVESDTEQVKKI
jgi:hypothetical protein